MAFLDKTGLERLWLHILSKTNQTLASAKSYADDIKNDLLNGAGGAYDTLKELGDLIDENADAIDAIERLADTKSDKGHIHDDRYYTEAEIDEALKFVKDASGEVITVNDSAEQALVGLKLYGRTEQATTTGKNLLNGRNFPTKTIGGITFTTQEDGRVHIRGTSTAIVNTYFTIESWPVGTFVISLDTGINGTTYFRKYYADGTQANYFAGSSFTVDGTESSFAVYLQINQSVTTDIVVGVQIEEGTTATTYEPYTGGIPSPNPDYPQELVNVGAGGSIKIDALGKNLYDLSQGIEYNLRQPFPVKAGEYYSVSVYPLSGTVQVNFKLEYADGTKLDYGIVGIDGLNNMWYHVSTQAPKDIVNICFYNVSTPYRTIGKIMVQRGQLTSMTDADYEPYKDGGSLTASTPNGLPGIPVTSGGNYTDTDGQQWLCDEIDFERGVYIQRVGRILIDSTNTSLSLLNSDGLCQVYTSPAPYVPGYTIDPSPYMMCDTLPPVPRKNAAEQAINGTSLTGDHILLRVVGVTTIAGMREWLVAHPTTVLYQPAQTIAIETPLSETELAAYRAMSTQNPTTTIYNDSNAWMEVEYADSRIDEIEEALSLSEVNYSLLNLVDGSVSGSVRGATNVREGVIIYDESGKDTGETYTIGENAFAIGTNTMAIGDNSYAEGYSTKAFGNRSHVEGEHNYARGSCSHAEGSATKTIGSGAHSEGQSTTAKGSYSHAEGMNTTAEGNGSHAEGSGTTASGGGAHAEGNNSLASAWASHAEGASSATNSYAHAEGINSTASGYGSHAEGNSTTASASYAHAEGTGTAATSDHSHAEGGGTTAEAYAAHAEGTDTVAKGNSSHSEGRETLAEGVQSHAEGYKTQAIGSYSHAEGSETAANGNYSHAEGQNTIASGFQSHAEGYKTQATDTYAHAEGQETKAGYNAHAEGYLTQATGSFSHAEGNTTIASKLYTHAEGVNTTADADGAHAEGNSTKALGVYSHAEGSTTEATNESAHAEGYQTHATGINAHAEGSNTTASGAYSHAEGTNTTANKDAAHAEGAGTTASGNYSHAEGASTTASGDYSHAEGASAIASGAQSHAEGGSTKAEAYQSHAEGYSTTASSDQSHAEGHGTTASGAHGHAEGYYSVASGNDTHAEGSYARAEGPVSHAEGSGAIAKGQVAHAEGSGTIATGHVSHVQGRFNVEDTTSTYAHIVGNGNSDTSRSNAHTLDWNGNTWYKGNISMGGTSQTTATIVMEYDSTNECLNFVFK